MDKDVHLLPHLTSNHVLLCLLLTKKLKGLGNSYGE